MFDPIPPQLDKDPRLALMWYRNTIVAWDKHIHETISTKYPRLVSVVEWVLQGVYDLCVAPAFAIITAFLLVPLVMSGTVPIITAVSVMAAWFVALLWVARAEWIKRLTIGKRLLIVLASAIVLAFSGQQYVKWTLVSYVKHQPKPEIARHVNELAPTSTPPDELAYQRLRELFDEQIKETHNKLRPLPPARTAMKNLQLAKRTLDTGRELEAMTAHYDNNSVPPDDRDTRCNSRYHFDNFSFDVEAVYNDLNRTDLESSTLMRLRQTIEQAETCRYINRLAMALEGTAASMINVKTLVAGGRELQAAMTSLLKHYNADILKSEQTRYRGIGEGEMLRNTQLEIKRLLHNQFRAEYYNDVLAYREIAIVRLGIAGNKFAKEAYIRQSVNKITSIATPADIDVLDATPRDLESMLKEFSELPNLLSELPAYP